MSRAIQLSSVVAAVHAGMRTAIKTYKSWCHPTDSWWAHTPESLMVAHVASELAKLTKRSGRQNYLTLEQLVAGLLAAGGGERRGKRPRNRYGRVDLVVWNKSGSPRILVEVKRSLDLTALGPDVQRLRQLVKRTSSSETHGLLALYMCGGSEEFLQSRFAEMTSRHQLVRLGRITRFRSPWHDREGGHDALSAVAVFRVLRD